MWTNILVEMLENVRVSVHVTLAYVKNSNYLCAKECVTVKGAAEKKEKVIKKNKKKRQGEIE
jgi:phenylpyruvate tautomerase PptA (4-oxalocrotonate tautomerase family)